MSRIDTYEHIRQVQNLLYVCITDLLRRSYQHDESKLLPPESEHYDTLSERLSAHEYGSDQYREVLRSIKPAIRHHYSINRHHPEYSPRGIRGMTLLDLMEMLCDWIAASQRPPANDIRKSLDASQARFGFSDELKEILLNTIEQLA